MKTLNKNDTISPRTSIPQSRQRCMRSKMVPEVMNETQMMKKSTGSTNNTVKPGKEKKKQTN